MSPNAVAAAMVRRYFYDHPRIERMLFDGVLLPEQGALAPDFSAPGTGIELKRKDAARFAA